ncbi:MAG: alpha/beta hydrolase fold domain-containing protein [Gemmatimonadaceae bacterium]
MHLRRVALVGLLAILGACGTDSTGPAPVTPVPNPNPNPPGTVTQRTFIDEAYGTQSAQRIDVYLPPSGNGPFRLIVWVHGGGWSQGSKALGASAFQRRVLAQGFALASVEYRLSGVAKFPAQIHDVKGAVRYLRANAARFALDPTRFGAWGLSAGGHLVALLGTSGGVAALEGSLGNPSTTSRVQAVVDWFGPTDFFQMDAQLAAAGCQPPGVIIRGLASSPESQLVGAPIAQVPALVTQANPITWISPDDPPFMIQHGRSDCTVPFGQSVVLNTALIGAGGIGAANVSFTLYTGAGHGGSPFTDTTNVDQVIAFFDRTLR